MRPYLPEKLPPLNINFKQLIGRVGEASAALARYDGLLEAIVNPEILLSPLTTNEAVLSSRIEGTQATLDEVLQHDAGLSPQEENKRNDIQEIVNYRSTLIQAEQHLAEAPFNLHLIRQMHQVLMTSVRGENREPGRFRTIQNWVGEPGTPLEHARYVPPEPQLVQSCMEDLVKYLQMDEGDVLIQTGIIHAQFEIIHPFLDGNGRIGRLLIPLYLYFKKRLERPMFYLSEYLENHREEYYAKLRLISTEQNWNDWLGFFLEAVRNQSLRNTGRVRRILDLHQEMRKHIRELTRSQYSAEIADALFYKPIFRSPDIQARTGIPKQTLMPILKQLIHAGIIDVIRPARGRSAAVLRFPQLLSITEG